MSSGTHPRENLIILLADVRIRLNPKPEPLNKLLNFLSSHSVTVLCWFYLYGGCRCIDIAPNKHNVLNNWLGWLFIPILKYLDFGELIVYVQLDDRAVDAVMNKLF